MKHILRKLDELQDYRQPWKVKHKLSDIIGIVLFATLGNANEWQEIEAFARSHEKVLKKYFKLENGIPSHDTMQRAMAMLSSAVLQELQLEWNNMLNKEEGQKLIKILNIDGKTMRGSAREDQAPLHIVSAWSKSDGICFGQVTVQEKTNEILAIPQLLNTLNIKKQIITIDAMGTQTKIAAQIVKQKGDYVFAVKGNQGNLYRDLIDYFAMPEVIDEIKKAGGYKQEKQKARSQIETREYYQSKDLKWLADKEKWSNLKSIGIAKNTITKGDKTSVEIRYYISSLTDDIEQFSQAVRGHWSIESMHWHLDVTFREDNNQTIDKRANENLNIIRKWCLSMLKILDLGSNYSLKIKRYMICCDPEKYLTDLLML